VFYFVEYQTNNVSRETFLIKNIILNYIYFELYLHSFAKT